MNGSLSKVFLASTLSLVMLGGCDDNNRNRASNPNPNNTTTRATGDEQRGENNNNSSSSKLPGTYAVPRTDTDNPSSTLPDAGTRGDTANNQAAFKSDAEILGMLDAVDRHEIKASAEAMKLNLSERVMNFAKKLHNDHSANHEKSMKLAQDAGITVSSPAKAEQLMKEGDAKLEELRKLNGVEFERAFIKEMIRGHMNALSTIDNQLLTATKNESVKSHLSQSREHIAHHLKEAQQLQDDFDKSDVAPKSDSSDPDKSTK